MEKQNQTKKIQNLEEDLDETKRQLENANSQIECARAEISSLETARKDLEAQMTMLTSGLQDSDVKGVFFYASEQLSLDVLVAIFYAFFTNCRRLGPHSSLL